MVTKDRTLVSKCVAKVSSSLVVVTCPLADPGRYLAVPSVLASVLASVALVLLPALAWVVLVQAWVATILGNSDLAWARIGQLGVDGVLVVAVTRPVAPGISTTVSELKKKRKNSTLLDFAIFLVFLRIILYNPCYPSL